MKKIYEAPSMEVTKIGTADVIMDSPNAEFSGLLFDIGNLWND